MTGAERHSPAFAEGRARALDEVAKLHGYPNYALVGDEDDGFYERLVDAVLDALGLEQVGWLDEVDMHREADDFHGDASCSEHGCRPVYSPAEGGR